MENKIDNIQIGDYTLKQWEEQMQAPSPASTVSYTDAEELGILSPDDNKLYQTLDTLGVEHPDENKEYEKLSIGESWADAGKALATEFSHLFMPKDNEIQYESRTKFGERVKYGYRYLAGTAGLMLGGGTIAGAKILANAGKIGKGVQFAGKLLSGKDLFKNTALVHRIGNAALSGALAGSIADFTLYRPEENEGHLADIFGQTDNALISYLQSQDTDTDIDAKLKNVVEGLVIGMGVGNLVEFGAKPLFKRIVKNLKAAKEGKEGAIEAVVEDQITLDKFASKADLVEQVQEIKLEAEATGQDASQLLIDKLHPEDNIEAQQMLKVLNDGEEIFVHSDGTWDISVNKWDDAHKVSPEEYTKQLAARDLANGGHAGDTAINHQDNAVRETWTNRGWVGADETLNQSNANKIVKQYQDKWQIDNKVKVEFVDGLIINGKQVEGNTSATKYIGKTTKTKQNAIDKKKLQISKLEDKITQLEGGNQEVADPLDNLKEELRIAKNELKELEKAAQGTNKIPDITIQIDSRAVNPYATLRAELEHARDIAKGEVPNQTERHFSRYEGMNEGEVASEYVYKKAQGKANATSQNFMNDGNVQQNVVKSTIEQNFDKWYNDKNSTATIGELVNHEAFSNGKYLDDVLNVEVGHTPPQYTSENELLAGTTAFVNGKLSIQVDTTLPPHIVEECIYHEIGHIRQIQAALDAHLEGDDTLWLKLKEHNDKVWNKEYKTFEEYASNELEVDAENTKNFLKGIKEQYEQQKPNNDIDTRGSGTIEQRNETPFSDSNTTTSFDAGARTQQGRSRGNSVSKSDGQTGVKYNQETINGQRTNKSNRDTEKELIVRRFVEGISQYNSARSDGNGVFIRRDAVWVVDTEAEKLFDDANISKTSYQELPQTVEAGQTFVNALETAKINLKERGEYVDVHTAEDYANARTFLSEDGLAGFAITKDGEIVSVFADPAAKLSDFRGRGRAMIELAKQLGGTHLNCYDVGLPNYYQAHGFKETNRYKWDDEFWKPDKWHKELHLEFNKGEPDVIDMALETKVIEPSTPVQPQQLKIDFSQAVEAKQSTEEITNGLISGELNPNTKEDVQVIFEKVEQLNPDISGFKFEDLVKDADTFIEKLESLFDEEDVTNLLTSFAKGDIDTLEHVIRKQMTAVHIMENLRTNVQKLGDKASVDTKVAVCKSVKYLGDYITQIKSGFGRGLNSQKLVNTTLESYGASRLSSWTKEGIQVYTQSIIDDINDIINLNFTRGQLIQSAIKKGLENEQTREFTQFLLNNKDIKDYFAGGLEKLAKQKKILTTEDLDALIIESLSVPEYTAMYKAAQLATDQKSFFKTVRNWMDGNGGLTSYYVHNLLSGVGSLVKNITSGAINTIYFPARKILASFDPFIDSATRSQLGVEGYRTYKCMLQSYKESWALMKEAFITGNGKLTDIGENTLNMNEGQFKGFHELKSMEYYFQDPTKFWEGLQNFHSLMTRAMGASDEFMSQLNYRAITRSKSLQEAERNAIEVGMKENEQWINEEADRIFQSKFNAFGKPLDVEALNEARTILYQNNLDGTMFDYATGQKEVMRDQTFAMKMASGIQTLANENIFIKCMFPFVKTGANILQMALDHNIFYMYASPAQRALLKSKTTEGALARSQCAFGAFSLCVGMMAAFNGMITGSAPSDPKERKALFATGWKPYSFKVGNKYISYQGYEPIHGMLGFAADCANMYSTITNPEDEARLKHFQEQIMPTLVNNFLDKAAFRTGLKQLDLIMNPKDTDEWAKAIAQTAKGFLPDVALVTNTKSIGKHNVLQPKTMYERIFYRYFPEKWTPMDYRRNVFGEKQSIVGLLITAVGSQEGSPEEEALEYLAQYGYTPTEIDDVIANTGLKISQFKDSETGRSALDAMKEEMSTLTIQGMTLREAIRALVTSEEYQYLPDGVDLDTGARWGSNFDTKINAVNDIFLMYKQRAKRNIMQNSNYFTNSEGETMDEAKEKIQIERFQRLTELY